MTADREGGADLGFRTVRMWETVDYSVIDTTWSENPFDRVATATFVHAQETRTTEMFYAGDDTWKFRFTGTRLGTWNFSTASNDAGLDGHKGSLIVKPRRNVDIKGFLTHVGNKFALQHDDADDLRGYLFNVYMNGHIVSDHVEDLADPAKLGALLDDTRSNGFDTAFVYLCHNWLKLGALRHDEHDSVNPDLATFDILEHAIAEAHARGMRWHFWAWGDESRKWTPHGLPGGINGAVDRRLQRYIAARLGPLPGWTMGYGFDLIEWTSEEGRNGWAEYLHQKMGWDHLLCTRGFPLRGTHNNITAYSGFGGRDLSTTRGGPADYSEVARHIDADPIRPAFYEERHSYLRDGFNLDMDGTRRLRWWQAMAGGLGGFYGFYARSVHPYPNPEQLRTFQRFWDGRFALDMERANDLTDGCALKTPEMRRSVFYKENASAIEIDLADMPRPAPAVAVDTAKDYEEINLGILDTRQHTLGLPYPSDWAVAVGTFGPGLLPHVSGQNGWLVNGDKAVLGWVQHNGWWRDGQRPNLTRRSVGDPKGDVRPNRTEDLDALTDNMLQYAYPGFEHNYGLWFDRRRDAHDTRRRVDAHAQAPFLEQPWARSTSGTAWDGLPKYDLEIFNPWYFERLKTFADLCDQKGAFLIHKYYMQHALLETQAHYADFPWRPANCIQDTAMPDTIPAANVFYDIAHPERRRLHRIYIRKCLDELGGNRNVIHLPGQEFTGPLSFTRFWLETVAEWERETGKDVNLGVGATKDVLDALLEDPRTEPHIDTIDLRYWWNKRDGTLFAPRGGDEVPGRGLERGSRQSEDTTFTLNYQKVRTYRDRYPDKAIIDALHAGRKASWAFFMAGGSLLVRGGLEYVGRRDPEAYEAPVGTDEILLTYEFLRQNMAEELPKMRPIDLARVSGKELWCLADPGRVYLAYLPQGGSVPFERRQVSDAFHAQWFNPRNGRLFAATGNAAAGDQRIEFAAPNQQDWALVLKVR